MLNKYYDEFIKNYGDTLGNDESFTEALYDYTDNLFPYVDMSVVVEFLKSVPSCRVLDAYTETISATDGDFFWDMRDMMIEVVREYIRDSWCIA